MPRTLQIYDSLTYNFIAEIPPLLQPSQYSLNI